LLAQRLGERQHLGVRALQVLVRVEADDAHACLLAVDGARHAALAQRKQRRHVLLPARVQDVGDLLAQRVAVVDARCHDDTPGVNDRHGRENESVAGRM
jgi:hypothetical protein